MCDTCYEVLLKAYGHQEHLRNRFKAKDGKSVKKRIPDRLKVCFKKSAGLFFLLVQKLWVLLLHSDWLVVK